jgi:hypothetical protein
MWHVERARDGLEPVWMSMTNYNERWSWWGECEAEGVAKGKWIGAAKVLTQGIEPRL